MSSVHLCSQVNYLLLVPWCILLAGIYEIPLTGLELCMYPMHSENNNSFKSTAPEPMDTTEVCRLKFLLANSVCKFSVQSKGETCKKNCTAQTSQEHCGWKAWSLSFLGLERLRYFLWQHFLYHVKSLFPFWCFLFFNCLGWKCECNSKKPRLHSSSNLLSTWLDSKRISCLQESSRLWKESLISG